MYDIQHSPGLHRPLEGKYPLPAGGRAEVCVRVCVCLCVCGYDSYACIPSDPARYGQRLVLVGLPALRESVLLLHKTVDPVITMDTQWYCVLELVASFRGHGVLRSSVSHGYFSCGDTRKTWHIVKRFKEMGLLVCKVGLVDGLVGVAGWVGSGCGRAGW